MLRPTGLTKKLAANLQALKQSPIIKNFFIYSFGSLLLRGISIFTAPITMSILAPKDYGLIALANSFVSILAVFMGLGLRQAFSIEYFHCNTMQRKKMISNMILLYLAVSTPFIVLFSFYPSLINRFVFVNNAPNTLIILSLAYCFLYFFVEFFYQVLAYRQQALKMTIVQTAIAFAVVGLNLMFLCWFKWGVLSLMASQVIGLTIVFFLGLHSYVRTSCHLYLNTKQVLKTSGSYLTLGLPFIPGVLCGWILASSDRWVLAHYSTMHDVGIYSLASMFGQLFQILILLPMSRAYIPAVMAKFSQNKNNLLSIESWNQKNMIFSMIGSALLVTVGYIIFKPILHFILPLRYQAAINYIWAILIGYVFLLGEHFASIFVIYKKKAAFQAASLFVPSLLNLGLNVALVPRFGIAGCVTATLASYITYFGIKIMYNFYLQRKDSTVSAP